MNKYKVILYTKYFEVPTSISCENVINYNYVIAENESQVRDIIYERFKDRKEIIKIEIYEKDIQINYTNLRKKKK